MRSSWRKPFLGHVYIHDGAGLRHGLLVIDRGFFMDDGLEVACSGARGALDRDVHDGVPNCLRCWAEMLA